MSDHSDIQHRADAFAAFVANAARADLSTRGLVADLSDPMTVAEIDSVSARAQVAPSSWMPSLLA